MNFEDDSKRSSTRSQKSLSQIFHPTVVTYDRSVLLGSDPLPRSLLPSSAKSIDPSVDLRHSLSEWLSVAHESFGRPVADDFDDPLSILSDLPFLFGSIHGLLDLVDPPDLLIPPFDPLDLPTHSFPRIAIPKITLHMIPFSSSVLFHDNCHQASKTIYVGELSS